ncbi:MAG: 2,3,4,5-tetrahydropyridine-2,6-dicarboxylate N-succinyltransferase, partial [Halieaceae bacterium]
MTSMHGFGLGLATKNNKGEILEVFYPKPLCDLSGDLAGMLSDVTGELDDAALNELASALLATGEEEQAGIAQQMRETSGTVIATPLTSNTAPASVADAYLKLHLLSHRLVRPHGTDLDGLFGLLPNVAWTNQGAVCLNDLAQRQLDSRLRGEVLEVASVDKFPKMTNYVVPTGVRIAHTARVRLGAYLGEGTTVMHEGFINFNAGTEGPGMVEGRISAGVWVGGGSDLGGGCSTMG